MRITVIVSDFNEGEIRRIVMGKRKEEIVWQRQ